MSEFTDRMATLERDTADLKHLTGEMKKTLQFFKNSPIVVGYQSKKLDLNEHLDVVKLLASITEGDDESREYTDTLVASSHGFSTITGITNDVVADVEKDTLTYATGNNILSILGDSVLDKITWTIDETNIDHDNLSNRLHDGDTVQIAGINSDDGAFPFQTTGTVSFNNTIDMADNPITNVDYMSFNLSTAVTPSEGQIAWNADDGTYNVGMPGGNVVGQLLQEMYLPNRPKNVEGSQIDNGKAIYVTGATGAVPEVALINATEIDSKHTIALATEDVANNQRGFFTTFGAVRELDTSGFSEGDMIYLDVTDGDLVNVKPLFPNYCVTIGHCTRSHASEGVIFANIDTDRGSDLGNFFNGSFRESFNALVSSDGATVTMSLERSGTGDLTMQFSDGMTVLDCTPAITIALTAGSDNSPTENFIYITKTNKILEKSTSNWPSEEHNKIGYFFVPSATFVQATGAYINQNWNDYLGATDLQGHMLHITEALRRKNATYFSGVDPNGTDDYLTPTAGNVELKSTAGVVYQLHLHSYPAVDTSSGDVVLVANWSGDSFHNITNLYDITADATGSAIGNNKYFNLTIWGVANKTGEYQPMMINLPGGSYNTQAAAEEDVSGHDNFTMSREFNRESSTGFLIARITIQMKTGGGTWVVASTTNLRGETPGTAAGGVGSIITEFADNAFVVFDETDNAKELMFDVGTNVTTSRTLIVPDTDSTILTSDGKTPLDGAWDMGNQILTNVNIDSGDINVAVTNVEWDSAYTHSQSNSQSHTDYLINNGDDMTSGTLDMATGSTIGNLTLADGSITDSSGDISLGSDNLTTTGNIYGNRYGCGSNSPASNILFTGNTGAVTDDTSVFGINLQIARTPSIDTSNDLMAFFLRSTIAGTHDIRDSFGINSLTSLQLSGASYRNIRGGTFSFSFTNSGTASSFGGFNMSVTGGGAVTTSGDAFGFQIADYTSRVTVGGTAYGFNQLGSSLINNFEGNIQLAGDNIFTDYGAGQDSGIAENGTFMLLDCDRQSAGSRFFRFDSGPVGIGTNPSKKFVVKCASVSDGMELLEHVSGNRRALLYQDASGDCRLDLNNSSTVTKVVLHTNGDSFLDGGLLRVGGVCSREGHFFAYASAEIAGVTAFTTLDLDTVVEADATCYSEAAGVVTIQKDGLYRIGYSIAFDLDTGTRHWGIGSIYVNSAALEYSKSGAYVREASLPGGSATNIIMVSLNATDTVELKAWVSSTACDIGGYITEPANMWMEYIRDDS